MRSVLLAKTLDQEMIEGSGGSVAAATTSDANLVRRSGAEVSEEIGGRVLVRYMLESQIGLFRDGSDTAHWVTPTPMAPDVAGRSLALPDAHKPRTHAMFIDPKFVPEVHGPRWVRGGDGIEYLLPYGFPAEALTVVPWEVEIQ